MRTLEKFKKRARYKKNTKKANKIIKENHEIIDFHWSDDFVIVPIAERKALEDANIIEEKELECIKKTKIKEPLMIYLDGLTREQKKKLPPLIMNMKITGPAKLNKKYQILGYHFLADSMKTYSQKLAEMGPRGRGRILSIEYATEDFDIMDKSCFENFYKNIRMTEKDIEHSKKFFDAGLPLSYVHEIDHRSECIKEFENSVEGIQKEIWS